MSKVLASRLKNVLAETVSSSPNEFVKGRQILDAAFVEIEVVHSRRKKGESGILC